VGAFSFSEGDEEMAEIRLHLTIERINALSVGERITFEEPSEASTRALRDMLANFVMGDNGEYMTNKAARQLLNRLSPDEFIEIGRRLYTQFGVLAVNPTPVADSMMQPAA
jgi:hypothetical protein